MKILVRKWNAEENRLEYVWLQVSNKPGAVHNDSFAATDGNYYYEKDILKISRDARKLYRKCNHCGKLVKAGDEEKHYAEKEKNINCFECKKLYIDKTGKYNKEKFVKQEDGTYMRTVKNEVKLYCNASYYSKTIEEAVEQKIGSCPYFKCRNNGISSFPETIFMKYPKMHDVFATEKSLIDNKFSLDRISNYDHTRIYKHNRFKNLKAVVDDNGIVIKFIYYYRDYDYDFVYSKVYDKFFSIVYDVYDNLKFHYSISKNTIESLMNLVRNVYAEGGK